MNKTNSYIEKCVDNSVFLSKTIESHNHYIVYHPCCMYNYCYTLSNLKEISPSLLKYNRKTTILFNNDYLHFQTSDVHIEIDFELLGVNEYSIFFQLFRHIKENMILNTMESFYIVCLHYQEIKKELLDIFYTFLDETKISFILCCSQLSFLPENMMKRCIIKKHKHPTSNLKYKKRYEERMNHISNEIICQKMSFFEWREKLYQLLIFNYNIQDCFSYLIFDLIEKKYIRQEHMDAFFKKYFKLITKFNNNYRTIYHLEHFIIYLININKKP